MSTISTVTALTAVAFMVSGCIMGFHARGVLWAGGDGKEATIWRDVDECVKDVNLVLLNSPQVYQYHIYSERPELFVRYVCPPPTWWCPIWRSGRAPGPTAWNHNLNFFSGLRILDKGIPDGQAQAIAFPAYRRCMEGKGYYEPDDWHRYFRR